MGNLRKRSLSLPLVCVCACVFFLRCSWTHYYLGDDVFIESNRTWMRIWRPRTARMRLRCATCERTRAAKGYAIYGGAQPSPDRRAPHTLTHGQFRNQVLLIDLPLLFSYSDAVDCVCVGGLRVSLATLAQKVVRVWLFCNRYCCATGCRECWTCTARCPHKIAFICL